MVMLKSHVKAGMLDGMSLLPTKSLMRCMDSEGGTETLFATETKCKELMPHNKASGVSSGPIQKSILNQ